MKPELLSPVQDFTSLRAAIDAGADAIYFGIKELNLRLGAKNFNLRDIKKVIDLCHKDNIKAYFTLNTIVYDNELLRVRKILEKLKKNSIDGIIAWDFSVIHECEKLGLPIHLSTQASVSSFNAIKILKERFKIIKRVNLARELSLNQIRNIVNQIKQNKLGMEVEVFVHGAMCVSISGRCFLSQEIFNKSANRGECLQPCRRKYIIKDIEEGHEFELGEDYIISPKDLCAIDILDKLIRTGINAFKIEGRNRSPEYVKVVTECYREAIDFYFKNKKINNRLLTKLKETLRTVYNRGFSTGFYLGKPVDDWSKAYGSIATKKKIYIGKIRNYYKKINVAEVVIESNSLRIGDNILIQGPTTGVIEQRVTSIEKNHRKTDKAKKGEVVGIKTERIVRANDKVFLITS